MLGGARDVQSEWAGHDAVIDVPAVRRSAVSRCTIALTPSPSAIRLPLSSSSCYGCMSWFTWSGSFVFLPCVWLGVGCCWCRRWFGCYSSNSRLLLPFSLVVEVSIAAFGRFTRKANVCTMVGLVDLFFVHPHMHTVY